jgi:hypothetical protein
MWTDTGQTRAVHQAGDTSLRDLRRLLGLLDDGVKETTYKPALLMALVDVCAEEVGAGHGDSALAIPLVRLAERVIELYWPQVRPEPRLDLLPDGDFYRLRQSPSEGRLGGARSAAERRIPRRVNALREIAVARGLKTALQASQAMPSDWQVLARAVAWDLARQPVSRLQRPPGDRGMQYERFLYDDSGFGERISHVTAAESHLVLRQGIARLLSEAAVLLRPAIEAKWTALVAKFNDLTVVESSLREYLFGAERAALKGVRAGLLKYMGDRCFWCGKPLGNEIEVDHVVPWSMFANDALFNLVLTDRDCNGDKSDILVDPVLLAPWVGRNAAALGAVEKELSWPVARERSLRIARAAYAGLPLGVPVWSAVGKRVAFDDVRQARATLLLVG